MEKTCRKCGITKSLEEYYIHPIMPDRHLNICKECTKKRIREKNRTPEGRAYDHARNQTPHRKAWLIKQQQKRRKQYREITKCRNIFSKAVASGKIKKQPCVKCGEVVVQGHHEDYNKPLEVIWLCAEHHRILHDQYRRKF